MAPATGGKDVFVHASALSRSGLSALLEGQKVLFEQGQGQERHGGAKHPPFVAYCQRCAASLLPAVSSEALPFRDR
ncbi:MULTISPECIES: cold shock domain-containing protein [unclassified Mesorhizobium]|uniref:cold-shock protein n=1 Tax=unclassified Mesorhizobium TaxID=325217 RepID=UPI002478F423|nr:MULTISPECIES: cold shock domain-containing protein [unclassified Mesorhizobium]